MKYRCSACGNLFDEDEIVHIEDNIGEAWGRPITERLACSPCCTEAFDEAEDIYRIIKVTPEMLKSLGRKANTDEDALEIVKMFTEPESMDETLVDAYFVYDDYSEIEYRISFQ